MKIIFLILSFIYINSINGDDFVGPAIVDLQRMEKCDEDMPGFSLNVIIKRFNRTHQAIDIEMATSFALEEIYINGTVSKWGDGGWKPHIFDIYEEVCSYAKKYLPEIMEDVLARMNKPAECPMDKGNYVLLNYVYDIDLQYPVMYGVFKFDAMFLKNNKTVTCLTAYLKSDPKPSIGL